jgi:hypothetical protein
MVADSVDFDMIEAGSRPGEVVVEMVEEAENGQAIKPFRYINQLL